MKLNSLFILLLLLFSGISNAQDVIYKNDKTQVKSKVLEVLDNEIKYKKSDFLEGPTYSMQKSEIYMIVYKNGKTEIFENKIEQTPVVKLANQEQKTSTTPKVKTDEDSSKYDVKKKSCNMIDFGVNIKNFSDYGVPSLVMTTDMVEWRNISVGGHIGYYSSKTITQPGFYDTTISSYTMTVGLRGNYYLNHLIKINPDKLQVYAGVSVIFPITNFTSVSNDPFYTDTYDNSYEVKPMVQTGVRFFFSKRVGMNVELEYVDEINAKIGISCRIWR